MKMHKGSSISTPYYNVLAFRDRPTSFKKKKKKTY